MSVRSLNQPVPARVALDNHGLPHVVTVVGAQHAGRGRAAQGGEAVLVEHILDSWRVDDRWWTDQPVRRSYYECQLQDGTRRVLVYDTCQGCWYVQR